MTAKPCVRCGSQEMEDGRPKAQHLVKFRPNRIGFFALRSSVSLQARMCRSCGLVELAGDPRELRDLLRA
jgi:ribosomal protein L40E